MKIKEKRRKEDWHSFEFLYICLIWRKSVLCMDFSGKGVKSVWTTFKNKTAIFTMPVWYISRDDSFCNLSPNIVEACLLQPCFVDFIVTCCIKKGFHGDSILKMSDVKGVWFAVSLAFGYLHDCLSGIRVHFNILLSSVFNFLINWTAFQMSNVRSALHSDNKKRLSQCKNCTMAY